MSNSSSNIYFCYTVDACMSGVRDAEYQEIWHHSSNFTVIGDRMSLWQRGAQSGNDKVVIVTTCFPVISFNVDYVTSSKWENIAT